jgi:hypothetical protein
MSSGIEGLDGPFRRAYAAHMVDTLVRPPGAPPSGQITSVRRPRRRWLRWFLVGLVLILIAGAAAGIVIVSNYQPFHAGYRQYGPPSGVSATVTRIDWLDAPPNVQEFRIPAKKGLTFDYRFSIWNHGPVPITLTRVGVPLADQRGNGVTETPVRFNPNVYAYPPHGGTWGPIRTLTLEPRQMAAVEMRVTVTSCLEQGALVQWNSIPVAFSVYGIHRHVIAPINVQIDLVGTQPSC